MLYCAFRNRAIFKILSVVLIAVFLLQDLVWADPEIISTSPKNSTLAPGSFTQDPESSSRIAAKLIEHDIDFNPSIPDGSILIAGIAAILRKHEKWLTDNEIRIIVQNPDEIIISFPRENIALRYYDSSLLPLREGYVIRHFERLGSLNKQVLETAGAHIPVRTALTQPVRENLAAPQTQQHNVAQAVRASRRYRERLGVLISIWRRVEAQRKKRSRIWSRWYRTFQAKKDASLAEEGKIRRSLERLNRVLIRLDALNPMCHVSPGAGNGERLEYLALNAREVLIRVRSMIGYGGSLERDVAICKRLDMTIVRELEVFLRNRNHLPDFTRNAAMLKGMSWVERRGPNAEDLNDLYGEKHSGSHAIPFEERKRLFLLSERLSKLGREAAKLSYNQAELNFDGQTQTPDLDHEEPHGAAVEGYKMEGAAIVGLIASIFIFVFPFINTSAVATLLTISYIALMFGLPIATKSQIESALNHESPWSFANLKLFFIKDGRKKKELKEALKLRRFGLIKPLSDAKNIKDIYYHDEDSRDKISYYSYSLETEGAPRNRIKMSQLYVNKAAMEHVSPMVQWIIFFHEWLHGYLRVRNEFLNVPLTYCLPWVVFTIPAMFLAVLSGDSPHDLGVLIGIFSYNIIIPIAARAIAWVLPSERTRAGHMVMRSKYWKTYTEKEIDEFIADYVHRSTRDESTGNMMPVREWFKSRTGGDVALIPSDPAAAEDIIVVKPSHIREAAESDAKKQGLASTAELAHKITKSAKRSFQVVLVVPGSEELKAASNSWHKMVAASMKEIRGSIRDLKPGAKVRFTIRSTELDITKLRGIQKFFRARQDRIVQSLLETEAVGCEVHGNVERLEHLTSWLNRNGYSNLVLMGDYLGKKTGCGFTAIDFLMDYTVKQKSPKIKMLIGKSEYLFLLAMLGDPQVTKFWPISPILEGPTVLEGLRELARKTITEDMPPDARREILDAARFDEMVSKLKGQGKGGMERWYMFHPKLLQIADFIINNMHVSFEDDHYITYTTGSRLDVEEFKWRGLEGVEAISYMEREFKEHAIVRLKAMRMISDIYALIGYGLESGGTQDLRKRLSKEVKKFISEERARNDRLGHEIIPNRTLDSIEAIMEPAIGVDHLNDVVNTLFVTFMNTEGPFSDIYREAFFEKMTDDDYRKKLPRTREERNSMRRRQFSKVGSNTTINLSTFTRGIRREKGWPKDTQSMDQVRLFNKDGTLTYIAVDSLDTPNIEKYLLMTDLTENEKRDGVEEGMSLESTTRDKLEIADDLLAEYEPFIDMMEEKWIARLLGNVRYYWSEIFLGVRSKISKIRPAGLPPGVWAGIMPWALSKGINQRLIAFLSGFEELIYSGLTSALPVAILSWSGVPTLESAALALPLGSILGYILFTEHHYDTVYKFTNGTLTPSKADRGDRNSIAALGLGLRAVFVISFIGTGNAAAALLVTIIAHGLYNSFVAPRSGSPLGISGTKASVPNIIKEVDMLMDAIEDVEDERIDVTEKIIDDIIGSLSRITDRLEEIKSTRAFRAIALPLRKRIEDALDIVDKYSSDELKDSRIERLEDMSLTITEEGRLYELDMDEEYEAYLNSGLEDTDGDPSTGQHIRTVGKKDTTTALPEYRDPEEELRQMESEAQVIAREIDPAKFEAMFINFKLHFIEFSYKNPKDGLNSNMNTRIDKIFEALASARRKVVEGIIEKKTWEKYAIAHTKFGDVIDIGSLVRSGTLTPRQVTEIARQLTNTESYAFNGKYIVPRDNEKLIRKSEGILRSDMQDMIYGILGYQGRTFDASIRAVSGIGMDPGNRVSTIFVIGRGPKGIKGIGRALLYAYFLKLEEMGIENATWQSGEKAVDGYYNSILSELETNNTARSGTGESGSLYVVSVRMVADGIRAAANTRESSAGVELIPGSGSRDAIRNLTKEKIEFSDIVADAVKRYEASGQDVDNFVPSYGSDGRGPYWESSYEDAAMILAHAGVKKGDTILDVGHGAGDTISFLAHLFGLRAMGVEVVPEHNKFAVFLLNLLIEKKYLEAGQVVLENKNFADADVDFSKYDFIYYFCLGTNDKTELLSKLFTVKPGAKILMYGSYEPEIEDALIKDGRFSREVYGESELLDHGMARIYTRVGQANRKTAGQSAAAAEPVGRIPEFNGSEGDFPEEELGGRDTKLMGMDETVAEQRKGIADFMIRARTDPATYFTGADFERVVTKSGPANTNARKVQVIMGPPPVVINNPPARIAPGTLLDAECREDFAKRPIGDDEKIILSENLFMEGGDRQELEEIIAALGPILNKPGGHIEILPEDDIVKYIKRSGRASRDKVAVILSSEDIDRPNSIWRDPDKAVSIKATVLAVGDKLTGPNYLYLTGLIGLARAVMANERDKVGMYYKLLTGSDIDSNVLSLIDPAGSNNTIPFALKAVLKFRPINKIDPAILDSMRIAMENFLISA